MEEEKTLDSVEHLADIISAMPVVEKPLTPLEMFKKNILTYAEDLYGKENVDFRNDEKLIIYFDELKIYNNPSSKPHTIKELYYVVSISSSGRIRETTCLRTKRTLDEWFSGYVFSHSSTRREDTSSGSMCYGSTVLQTLVSLLNHEYNEDNWILFINMIKSYFTHESSEGGPYMHYSSVKGASLNSLQRNSIARKSLDSKLLKDLLRLINFDSFTFDSTLTNFNVDNLLELRKKLSEVVTEECLLPHEDYNSKTPLPSHKTSSNKLFFKVIDSINKRNIGVITFKGEVKYFRIDDSEYTKENTIESKHVMLIPLDEIQRGLLHLKEDYIRRLREKFSTEYELFFKQNTELCQQQQHSPQQKDTQNTPLLPKVG